VDNRNCTAADSRWTDPPHHNPTGYLVAARISHQAVWHDRKAEERQADEEVPVLFPSDHCYP